MKTHTDLLNLIAAQIKAKTYLEIGVFNPAHNFDLIAVPRKVSVDPDPKADAILRLHSDSFFNLFPDYKADLIFIDGLHHADQVKRDLINAWGALNEGGVVVMHDCNPPTEATTCVPRGTQREWCGDVYKIAGSAEAVGKFTVDFDYGCTVLRKLPGTEFPLMFENEPESWEDFDAHRHEYLQLISVEDAIENISKWE